MRSSGAILPPSAPTSEVAGHTRLPGPYLPRPGCSLAAGPQHGAEHTVGALDICRRTEGCCPPFQCDIPRRLYHNMLIFRKNNSTLPPPREDVRSTMQILRPQRGGFSGSGVRPSNLHVQQPSQETWTHTLLRPLSEKLYWGHGEPLKVWA